MPLSSFQDLFSAADQLPSPVGVVAAGGADATVIQALELARRRGWVHPILTGDREQIQERADAIEVDLEPFVILEDAADSAAVAVNEVTSGRAAFLMKGQISTPHLMKAVLDKENGLRTGHTIGQVVLMEILRDNRCFLMTDTGISITPTSEQLEDLIRSVVEISKRLGEPKAKVALMAASEKVVPSMPETVVAQELVEKANQGAFGDCLVQGPLSFDLAYSRDASNKKGIDGEVTGCVDAMVFPNLLSANLTVKGMMYTSDCQFGGILTGTSHPVVFMSRADTVETRLNSIAYALHVCEAGVRSLR
ncbi:Phosphate acetyltransferase [Thalassoglobus neptunius]|uniref:Phosphate acetyltransferase n=1 Tax=Thalassoglobus neptunius TaxID=1938619 RepID=A0A5C5X781_9PLAN|nr:phosphate acyltransferase [Thalassoglobus neptunius]TWT58628.1 Phosphate acetyltransferase [Thalassoglobus neptunius]